MEPELVRLSLIAGPNDLDRPDQLQQLQQKLQEYLNSWLCASMNPNSSRCVLQSLKPWLQGGRGRKVRFETVVGEMKAIEAKSSEEIDDLIGADKTPASFLQAFARALYSGI